MKKEVTKFEQVIIVLSFIISTGAIIPVIFTDEAYSDNIFKVLFFLLYSLSLLFSLRYFKGFSIKIFTYKLLITFILFIGLSVFWSAYPSVTISKYIALVGTTLIGIYIAIALDTKQILKYLSYCFFIIAILSLVFVMFFPNLGIHHGDVHEGVWKGVYTQKNSLGRYTTYGLIVTILCWLSSAKNKPYIWISIILQIILLFGSQSTTSILLVFVLLLLVALINFVRINLYLLFSIVSFSIIAILIFVSLILLNAQKLVSFFNKDLTFSGRTDIWYYSWIKFCESPVLGYGFGAFWHKDSMLAYYVRQQVGWMDAPHAHNLTLDFLLQIGLIGTGIYLIILFSSIFNSIRLIRLSEDIGSSFFFITLISIVLFGLTESTILVQNNLFWILFIIIIIRLPIDLDKIKTL